MLLKCNIKKPKVTVVMSTYNGQQYLYEAIDSILNQKFINFEFAIINDASTDKTADVLKNYAAKDERIILIYNDENLGLTKSLNKGLKLARGEYIARQDADDISEPSRLGRQVDFLDKNQKIFLVGTHVSFIDKKDNAFYIWKTPKENEKVIEALKKGNCFAHGSVMFRRECLNFTGLYREEFKYAQDYDLWLRISERYKMANIEEVLYKLRRRSDSISRRKLSEQLDYHLLVAELAKERKKIGRDSLKSLQLKNIESVLINKYKMPNAKIKKFKSGRFIIYFHESLQSKNYSLALKLWLKSFLMEPKISKIIYLAKKCLLKVLKSIGFTQNSIRLILSGNK